MDEYNFLAFGGLVCFPWFYYLGVMSNGLKFLLDNVGWGPWKMHGIEEPDGFKSCLAYLRLSIMFSTNTLQCIQTLFERDNVQK